MPLMPLKLSEREHGEGFEPNNNNKIGKEKKRVDVGGFKLLSIKMTINESIHNWLKISHYCTINLSIYSFIFNTTKFFISGVIR